MCSVRHSPIPSAPKSRAIFASSGVSAFARTPSLRTASAHDRNFLKYDGISGSTVGTRPSITSPADPSSVMYSPRRIDCAIRRQRARAVIDLQRRHSRHARLAHPARDHRRMTRHPAARREDSLRDLHPVNIFRRRFEPHQNYFAPRFRDRDRFVRREHHFAVDRARRRRQSARDHVLLARRVEPRMQKLLELFRLDALQRRLAIDQLLVGHIDRDSHRRLRRALAVARLQHEQAGCARS